MSATASDGVTVCDGSTTFDVTNPDVTVTLTVHLTCAVPTGDVSVNATLNICPTIDDLTAAPLILKIGGVSTMSVVAHDADNGPAPLSYSWSVNGIKLPRQTSTRLLFACSSPGDVMVAASASDGDPNPGCADSASVKVTCQ